MIRKIIKIDEEKCTGCGLCAEACHEGAIEIINGKAQLIREDYCDGLGDCLPSCPTGAISFESREAKAYDENAVNEAKKQKVEKKAFFSCPGSMSKSICRDTDDEDAPVKKAKSRLRQWPCQIKLAPISAPYYDGANLLIAADCTAYAYGSFHEDFMKNRITLIGCPKLDAVDYSEKLTEIIKHNDIKSITVLRMVVPCCGGIENSVRNALIASGKLIPLQVVTITTDGKIM